MLKEDEIVNMARQTLSKDIDGLWLAGTEDLKDFVALVYARADNDIREEYVAAYLRLKGESNA